LACGQIEKPKSKLAGTWRGDVPAIVLGCRRFPQRRWLARNFLLLNFIPPAMDWLKLISSDEHFSLTTLQA